MYKQHGCGRVCCLLRRSIVRDDEPAVVDLDPHALPGLEASKFKPSSWELDPWIKRRISEGSRIDAPVSQRLLDGNAPLGMGRMRTRRKRMRSMRRKQRSTKAIRLRRRRP